MIVTVIFACVIMATPARSADGEPQADESQQPAAPEPSPLRDPVLSADAVIRSQRTISWRDGDIRWLLMDQDVEFSVGAYGFRARRALVRIEPQREPGKTIHHVAVYFDTAQSLGGRSRVEAEAPRLLVTVSTHGKVELATDLLTPVEAPPEDAFVADGGQRIKRHLDTLAAGATDADLPAKLFGPRVIADPRQAPSENADQPAAQPKSPPSDHTAPPAQIVKPTPQTSNPAHQSTDDSPAKQAAAPSAAPTKPKTSNNTAVAPQIDPHEKARPIVAPTNPTPASKPVVVSNEDDPHILPANGVVSFKFKKLATQPLDDQERTVALTGPVIVMYQDFENHRTMTLTAGNAVIFLAGADLGDLAAAGNMDAKLITGVYLEENVVVTDGRFTVRAPQVFIDPRLNKAVLLDAVVFTVDPIQGLPLYMRAKRIRQESRRSWSAKNAVLTTSDFAEPHFSIAASRLTLEQTTSASGAEKRRFTAQGIAPKVGPTPLFYWPYATGSPSKPAIKHITFGSSKDSNERTQLDVRTRWDLFTLAGQEAPEGVELLGDLDWRGDHGLALGAQLDYDLPQMYGAFRSYLLPKDDGEDDIGGREDIAHNNDQRGFARLQHRQYLQRDLELSLEFAYASDETFLEEFFREQTYNSKPYETSLYLKQQRDQRAFTLLASYNLNDFLAQNTTLQTPGYFVDKLPELGYYRLGTNFWDNRLTYFTENRLSRLRIRGGEDSPRDRGFSFLNSPALFGIPAGAAFDTRQAGIPNDYRLRLDTRHELQAPMSWRNINIVPYVAGRVTAYDDDFSTFAGEDEQVRLWGMVGTRFHTQFHRAYADVENRLFDLHQLRHIIEPSANVFSIASNINPEDIPVYDTDVERIQQGFGARFGVRQTFQTQRGGPGQWRNVDWLVLNTDFVIRGDDADVNKELARFYDYRPEFSIGGDHFASDLRWLITDTLALAGEVTYSFEHENVPVWRIGASMQHTPRLTSYLDYSEIDLVASQLLTYGFRYDLTRKWRVGYRHRISLSENENRDLSLTLERRIPQWTLLIAASHDDIDDEQTLTISLVPQNFDLNAFNPGVGNLALP